MTARALRRSGAALSLLLLAGIAATGAAAQENRPLPNPLAPKASGEQPTLAPEEVTGRPPAPPNTQEPMDEITVIAPRRVLPDFQTTDEFYRAEFERIRGQFEKPAEPPPRAYEVFDSGGVFDGPNERSTARDMMRGAGSLRETFSGGPPKAEPDPR